MRYIITQLIILLIPITVALGQGTVVSGTVTDGTGEGLPGVTVRQKDTSNGAITGIDGSYTLNVPGDATLIFTYVGFETQEVTVGNRSTIDIVLSEELSELEEVVVIGYGVQKKKVLTGAIESVSAEEISATPVVSADQALQGRSAGVQILNQSGQPGERPSIRVRGIGTNGNSDPLILVDGMAVQSIDNINPADIESMEVLKDAASASIYGARAANGVILITTKGGSNSGKTTVTYNGYVGFQNAAKKVDLLNADEYIQIMANAGANDLAGNPFDANQIPSVNTDWQEELFTDNAPIQSHYVGIEGGNEKTAYSSSLSYFEQQGIIGGEKSRFERYSARLNSNTKVNDVLRWGSNFNYTHIKTRGVTSNGSFNSAFGSALNLDPLTPVFETNADVLNQAPYATEPVLSNAAGNVYGISNYVAGEINNPLARLEIQTQEVTKDQILGNLFVEIEPIENLKIRSTGGVDLSYLGFDAYQPLYYLTETFNNLEQTNIVKQYQRSWNLQQENTANYTKKIGPHNFNFLVGTTVLDSRFENLVGGGQGVDTSNPNLLFLDNITVDTTRTSAGGADRTTRLSFFSRLLYDYNDRVSFSVTQRRDGSSNFGANNKFANFWAFGASWVINEEPFFPQWEKLTFLKLRTSWGQNGNDRIGTFRYASIVDFAIAYNQIRGATPAFLENQDIRWETSEQLDIGFEAGLFDNRLTATFDYYVKTTKDLLQVRTILGTAGILAAESNVGEVQNKGVELSLQWRNSVGELNYSIGVNASYNKNTMTKVASESGFIEGASWALAGEVTRIIEGQPIVSFFGFKTDGIFQSEIEVAQHFNEASNGRPLQPNAQPGDIRFVDTNNDGVISDDDRVAIGSPLPDWTLGSTISADYKGFDFSMLLTGQLGLDVFNGINRPDISTSNRQSRILDQWSETNPSNDVPRFLVLDQNQNYTRATDMVNIEDGSYLRIKNLQVGYRLPSNFLEKFKCTAWRWFVSVENLATFTGYSGPDPEVGSTVTDGNINVVDTGIDRGIYPQARTFRIGTSITF